MKMNDIKKMLKEWLKQMLHLFIDTFHFKRKTPLYQCKYALGFQLLVAVIWMLFVYSIIIPDLRPMSETIVWIVWILLGYITLTLIPTISLLISRFRDAGVSGFHVLVLPIPYILFVLLAIGVIKINSLELIFLIPLLTFFFTHYYLLMFAALPTKKQE